MDKVEAGKVLREHLSSFRQRSYTELLALIGRPSVAEINGPSDVGYQIEVEAFWDSRRNSDLRVVATIDDGGWRAFVPLVDDFIISADGQFVGE